MPTAKELIGIALVAAVASVVVACTLIALGYREHATIAAAISGSMAAVIASSGKSTEENDESELLVIQLPTDRSA